MLKSKLQQYVGKIRASLTSSLSSVASPSSITFPARSTTNDHTTSNSVDSDDTISTVKNILKDFLDRLPYQSPHTPHNADLRREVSAEIASWNAGFDSAYIEGLTDTSCTMAECSYAHTTYEHQRVVALYTAFLTSIDDHGKKDIETVGQFVQHYIKGERQPIVALDRLTSLLRTIHDLYPHVNADAIVTNTLDCVGSFYMEMVVQGDTVAYGAAKWPYYLRLKTGVACAFAHFNFMKSWGDSAGTYHLQLIPELELVGIGVNDIISFYKETLAGETDNYVHMRAAAEGKTPIDVLRQLVEEVLESVATMERLACGQDGLKEIVSGFVMGYVELHVKARRYRMHELDLEFR